MGRISLFLSCTVCQFPVEGEVLYFVPWPVDRRPKCALPTIVHKYSLRLLCVLSEDSAVTVCFSYSHSLTPDIRLATFLYS